VAGCTMATWDMGISIRNREKTVVASQSPRSAAALFVYVCTFSSVPGAREMRAGRRREQDKSRRPWWTCRAARCNPLDAVRARAGLSRCSAVGKDGNLIA
jgi:hypothetical protein